MSMATRVPKLGEPISLADLLALPPDGNDYGRDEKGKLILLSPDDTIRHRLPGSHLATAFARALDPGRHQVVVEPSISFGRTFALDGSIVPPSRLGPKAVLADIVCFERPIRKIVLPSGLTWFGPETLRLVVEILSPSTWRTDLGVGSSPEEVDRWRTYLESGVAEYWIVNAGYDGCGLPPHSALFLTRGSGEWIELPVEGARAEVEHRGLRPLLSGVVRSKVLPEVSLDLDKLWADLARG